MPRQTTASTRASVDLPTSGNAFAVQSINASEKLFADVVIIVCVTVACMALGLFLPESWNAALIVALLAPAAGLLFGSIPALLIRYRYRRILRWAAEQEDLVALLLKDYSANRSDWLWATDESLNLRGVSEKFASRASQSLRSLEGMKFLDFLKANLTEQNVAYKAIELAIRQNKTFLDIEAKVMHGEKASWWRFAGKPVFRNGRFAGYVGTAADVTTELLAKERISFLAHNDSLTGLANRPYFTERLSERVARLERYGTAFSVLYLDLDKFKAVNDTRGHQAGDKLLVEVGRRLRSVLRETDTAARLGGDEFAVILPDDADRGAVAALANRLIAEVEKPYLLDNDSLFIGLSVGIAIAPVNGTRPDQILRNADLALYRAKAEGGNRFCFFDNRMDSDIRERRILESELSEALDRGEFVLHYQPVIAASSGTVAGYEALIRWNHPIRGLLQPASFIPIAEQSMLIGAIGEWTILEACRALQRFPEQCYIAVNLSTKHFRIGDVPAMVRDALEATDADPRRLELEITESLLIDNPEEMAGRLRKLHDLGVKIAMDDFGTGFSSLSYLLRFSFDKIKIDKSFVAASSEDVVAKEILRAILGMSTALEIQVTAEGVETEPQMEFLTDIGCDFLQGYLFSRPIPETMILQPSGPDARALIPERVLLSA